ncbi:ABC transporter permease [Paracoccus denitrificans]|jgi:lipoprotein-releasing system permease protein|uniref:Lipoprotein releasing system, transmembrane protein, LolC/E family n=1 Tax=Paracoccus denitrificans (strain Pd 1222) TaxID=318586 RepID=A1B343_PARDP|nr:ABC transporter permease [Paracoccus denitrificans]ABL69937.1 lipoprotein releasing system, transmembrane protein, LolC/E family [Paracoccus denitrificans PD1222]MBB4627017.1 lipoprotein-releasing system permease protein [Paracoccus denitrificans]MCU7428403.1 ABC transporter permease [Paracoccus denitrificans]QAR25323.1 FtsX-like permease family protein [Paracoccus denitrificans]UFS65123.1 ABC transporter permease [Paracoccus denitrificans]
MASTAPFSRYEFMIAWRYLRARRAEGGVSVMTWISLIGITLGVMALVATLAVRAGFRAEFVDTILGANAHSTVYYAPTQVYNELTEETYVTQGRIEDYDALAARIAQIPGVTRAVPAVRAQVMARQGDAAALGDVHGITLDALGGMAGIADPESASGSLDDFDQGIAIGIGMARNLGVRIGDRLQLVAPDGAKTPFGTTPRVESFEVVYIFSAGRYDVDQARIYMPLAEAQSFFNREGLADEIGVYVADPERVDDWTMPLLQVLGERGQIWTWRDASGSFLAALDMEDDVMFIILSILVLIASMNITSGLIMLVKNKGRDIGILRTMGLTEGSVLRVFFLCGAFTGVIGTIAGVVLGVLLSLNVDHIMAALNMLTGGNAWQPEVRGIYQLTAELRGWDIFRAAALSLALSFIVTIFPARRAARMNPVEALRYE